MSGSLTQTEGWVDAAVVGHEEIAAEAYGLYAERGYVDGYEVDDWLTAESRLRERLTSRNAQKAR